MLRLVAPTHMNERRHNVSIARSCAITLALAVCQAVEASQVRTCVVCACHIAKLWPAPAPVHSNALTA